MNKYLGLLIVFGLMGCSSDDKGSGNSSNAGGMRGSFKVTAESTAEKAQPGSCALEDGSKATLDPRLKAGMVFNEYSFDMSQTESLSGQQDQVLIESVDTAKQNFTKKSTLISFTSAQASNLKAAAGGWIRSLCQLTNGANYSSMNCNMTDASFQVKQIINQAQQSSQNETWVSCFIRDDWEYVEPKYEEGIYTLSEGGRQVKAYKSIHEDKGPVHCVTYKEVNGQSQEVSSTKMGQGKVRRISIYTSEIPSRSSYCNGKSTNIYTLQETVLDDGRVLEMRGEEILGGSF